jgi:hypothetical protein
MLALNVSAASSRELEQQPSQDHQPLLQQQPQGNAKGRAWHEKALSLVNESVSTGCAATVCRRILSIWAAPACIFLSYIKGKPAYALTFTV